MRKRGALEAPWIGTGGRLGALDEAEAMTIAPATPGAPTLRAWHLRGLAVVAAGGGVAIWKGLGRGDTEPGGEDDVQERKLDMTRVAQPCASKPS